MKPLVILFLFLGVCTRGFSQTTLPPLPEELKTNASAVVRLSTQSFEIKSIGSAVEKIKTIVTILNKKGDSEGVFSVSYDPYSKVSSLSGIITGSDGKVIKKLKRDDFADYPAYDGSSFYSDLKVLAYEPVVNAYPYTVEYEYTVNHNGLLQYPVWIAQDNPEVSVENKSFEIITHNGIPFRYLTNKIGEPVTSVDGDKKSSLWKVSGLKPYGYEPFRPAILEVSPTVFTAPIQFEFHNTNGNLNSWNDFGSWISNLNKGKDELPAPTKEKIKKLIEGAHDTTEMVKRVYNFLQNKTRYVGVQLGIGGYQPMPANEVDAVGYGDCKALSNYMVSLLKCAGIKAHYTLISSGSSHNLVKDNFPINLFNHVIVCVPLQKDTIWLECTSQHAPFGYLGSSTYNRKALVVGEKTSKLVNTPDYPASKNTQVRCATVNVDINGDANASISTSFGGLQFENVYQNLYNQPSDQKKWFENRNQIPVFQTLDYKYTQPSDFIPVVEEKQSLRLDRYAGVNPKMLVIPLNLMNRPDFSLKQLKQ
ncbi:MAG TPA: DUF3857 and transglutaminase domain-containing protein, partial [Bacteroidales bacterium]|nr:DUF3857 and transglutaminase domain-containing protein [Bacteroidales bacterium]